MADYTVTAADVGLVRGPTSRGLAGATVTRGQPVYVDYNDEAKLKPADVNPASNPQSAAVVGVCIEDALDDVLTTYARAGAVISPGTTLTKGDIVVLSESGNIGPAADLTTGDYVVIIGIGLAADRMELILHHSGTVVP
jgi:hypothetical protein